MSTLRKSLTRGVVLAIASWSFVIYLLVGTWREPYGGLILCPEGTPNCHDVEPPPFALWWAIGLILILVCCLERTKTRR